jgi:hypothetical protein
LELWLPFCGFPPALRQPQLQVVRAAARLPVRAENGARPFVAVAPILAWQHPSPSLTWKPWARRP